MYIDCDTHYFPVKFLEGISDQYPDSPRVVRKGDEVKSVLPDGTLIKNQAPKGRWDLDVRVQQADFEGFDKHVLIPRTGSCCTPGTGTSDASWPGATTTRWPRTSRNAPIRSATSASAGCSCRTRKSPARSSTGW